MAMLIDKCYKVLQELANKDAVSGYLSPAEFNKWAEFAQRDLITEVFIREYEGTKNSIDVLSEVRATIPISISGGQITKPTDFMHYCSSTAYNIFDGKGRPTVVNQVRDDEWGERMASEINKPTKFFPIMREKDGVFEIAPTTINQVVLSYIKVPLIPWWNYTLSGSTPVFAETGGTTTNPNTATTVSTDFAVGEAAFAPLVFKMAKYFGIEVKDADLYQGATSEQRD
jgi:hypothetical protein